jgi:hypothetical protein
MKRKLVFKPVDFKCIQRTADTEPNYSAFYIGEKMSLSALEEYRGRRGKTPCFLNIGTILR